jgi:hypothetical protein
MTRFFIIFRRPVLRNICIAVLLAITLIAAKITWADSGRYIVDLVNIPCDVTTLSPEVASCICEFSCFDGEETN